MFGRNFYYALKPYVPWRVRMAMRRVLARRKLATSHGIWPIDEEAGRQPAEWPGWPNGKKFAVVLTHDVEGQDGVDKTRRLAELEMRLGFRSSFNFIPEGSYEVPVSLRDWLGHQGFEVGVHDLQHDGRLYDSRRGFERKAIRINQHLRDWHAVGFRSGFMLHNLDWIHDLEIEYDLSTFDTDPFEPQPEAARTIFPFWVPRGSKGSDNRNGSKGYAELPYSLPQDSTLFLVLQERTNAIWRRKLDWVASRGGLVLLNVHPDYLDFKGPHADHQLKVEDHYADLLGYLTETYGQSYWAALPREISAFVHHWKNPAATAAAGSRP